jgi:uncharacterized OsmC-like protein
MAAQAKVFEYDVSVDRSGTATSGRGGSALPQEEAWLAEHLVLAGLVRCTLASLDHAAQRAEVEAAADGRARGTVSKREEDGRYAFVEIEASFEVELSPPLEPAARAELIERAERGCFVGNSLTARPRYRWTVNGEALG